MAKTLSDALRKADKQARKAFESRIEQTPINTVAHALVAMAMHYRLDDPLSEPTSMEWLGIFEEVNVFLDVIESAQSKNP